MHSSVRDWKDSLKNLVVRCTPTRTEREDQHESNIFDMLITSSIEICDTVWNCDPNSHATFMSHRTYHFARPFAFHAVNLCRVVSYLSSRPWNNAWYFLTFSFFFFFLIHKIFGHKVRGKFFHRSAVSGKGITGFVGCENEWKLCIGRRNNSRGKRVCKFMARLWSVYVSRVE